MKVVNLLLLILSISLISCSNNKSSSEEQVSTTPEILNSEDNELYALIKEKDSLLFQIGFNQIDTVQVAKLTATDFEFYHDENGVTETKRDFLKNIEGIRDLPFKTWRTLVDGSTEVFPMYKDNSQTLYGAIQHGVHDFYQQKEGEDARKTNTARFTHLWVIENDDWKLKRVLSYDHQVPNQ